MGCINTRGRAKEALGWGAIFAVVFVAQGVDALMFDNKLQHFTNWSWLLHGVVAATNMCSSRAPHVLKMVAFSASVFVAAGIACIRVMDSTFIRDFEKDVGVAVTTTADIVFHWLPVLFWSCVLLWTWRQTVEWCQNTPVLASLSQINLIILMVAAIYGILFDVQQQYPGDNISFDILFATSAACVSITNAFVLLYSNIT